MTHDELMRRLRAERYTPIPRSETQQERAERLLTELIRSLDQLMQTERAA